jgi:hypothetical protein
VPVGRRRAIRVDAGVGRLVPSVQLAATLHVARDVGALQPSMRSFAQNLRALQVSCSGTQAVANGLAAEPSAYIVLTSLSPTHFTITFADGFRVVSASTHTSNR